LTFKLKTGQPALDDVNANYSFSAPFSWRAHRDIHIDGLQNKPITATKKEIKNVLVSVTSRVKKLE